MEAQPCPECGHELPVHERLSTWCDRCSWNLRPVDPEPPKGRLARAYAAAGVRLGARLVRELRDAESLKPRLTANLLAAYAIAVLVLAFWLALVIGGVALALSGNPVAIAAAVVMGGLAVLMRPRPVELPEEAEDVEPDRAPRLHALVSEVAGAIGAPAPRRLRVDHDYNAYWTLAGWRRERVLTLGLPLLTALDPAERVALVAHELGHGRNGDARRGLVVGTALHSLVGLLEALVPDHGESGWGPIGALVDGVLWLLTRPVVALLYLEYTLLMRDSQRAESLADELAARAAGTGAAAGLLEKLLLEPVWYGLVRTAAVRRESDGDLFEALREAVAGVPERERERRRRVARLEDMRLDISHPPTYARLDLLHARPPRSPSVALSAFESDRIDDELRELRPRLTATALDESAGALYSG